MGKSTCIIPSEVIRRLLTMKECFEAVEKAFALHGAGEAQMPPKVYLYFEKGDLRCMPAYIPSLGLAAVKNVNVHPGNVDLPAVMATITLVDPETGFPPAIMDGTLITRLRTGAAGGVAARHLAREDATTASFIGAGAQARTQLAALLVARPGLKRFLAHDRAAESVEKFAGDALKEHGVRVETAPGVREAALAADILVTTTPSRVPLVTPDMLKPGVHINAIGADARGKQELDGAIIARAKVVIDSWEQASHSGEINVPFSRGQFTREDVYADLGHVVIGRKKGRTSAGEITVFDSTGLAIQDLACAALVWQKVQADPSLAASLTRVTF